MNLQLHVNVIASLRKDAVMTTLTDISEEEMYATFRLITRPVFPCGPSCLYCLVSLYEDDINNNSNNYNVQYSDINLDIIHSEAFKINIR